MREKNGSVTFRVRSKETGKEWEVHPRRYLAPHQEKEMSVQPDLILQLAHHIAREYKDKGHGEVEVRADAIASLNGHPSRRLLDPDVDLAAINDGLGRASWIASMEPR